MAIRRLMIPFLAAVLVMQGLVAGVPHQHRTAPAVGLDLQVPSSIDAVHDCFACSIHAPAVDLSVGFAVATGSAVIPLAVVDRRAPVALAVHASSNPRGPPRVV